jgi:hypothetical protein
VRSGSPTDATGSYRSVAVFASSITTSSNPSAAAIASQTWSRISWVERLLVSLDDTSSSSSSPRRRFASRFASSADSTARAAYDATATSASSSSSLGVRPLTGRSTDRTPIKRAVESRIGTKSASSGSHSPTAASGT